MLKKMILYLSVAVVVASNLLNIPAARASDHDVLLLVEEGQPRAQIVISEEPERLVKLAAQELRDYVQKISGAELPVVTDPDPEVPVRILVGRSAETDALGITGEGLEHGAFSRVTGPDYLVLIGHDFDYEPPAMSPDRFLPPHVLRGHEIMDHWDEATRAYTDIYWGFPLFDLRRHYHEESGTWFHDESGSLNAVYEQLRMWGVRWYFPGEIGEVVPETTTLAVPALDTTVTPDFKVRRFFGPGYFISSLDDILWIRRLGLNYGYPTLGSVGNTHGHRRLHAREEMQQQHPEYFALIGGERYLRGRGHVCYSSEGLIDETIRYVRAVFDILGEPTVDLWPEDGFQMCECEKCAGKTPAEVIFPFVKRVAEEVIKTHPDRLITCGAYASYRFPPDNLDRFPPNVAVSIAFQRPGLDDPESWGAMHGGISYEALMEGWMSKVEPGNIMGVSNHFGRGVVMPRSIAADLRFRKGRSMGDWNEVGPRSGIGSEVVAGRDIGPQTHLLGLHHINQYVNARLLWDADQDLDALMNEYYEKFYGPVADLMKAAIEMAENSYTRGQGRARIPMEAQVEVIELMETARDKAGDTIYGRRIAYILEEEPSSAPMRASLQAAEARGDDVREFWRLIDLDERRMREAAETIVMDGQLDEPFWTEYPHVDYLRDARTGASPSDGTGLMMRWHQNHLYLGVRCAIAEDRELEITATEDGDPAILEGDSVTLLLETQDHSHYEITVNPAGAIFDADHSEGGEGTRWTAQVEVATHVGDGYWSAELRIPVIDRHDDPLHKVVGRRPTIRYPWYFNVVRRYHIGEGEIELSAWEPTGKKDFQDPLTFGRIYLRPHPRDRIRLQKEGVRLGPREIAK